jgi:hypothetical protein
VVLLPPDHDCSYQDLDLTLEGAYCPCCHPTHISCYTHPFESHLPKKQRTIGLVHFVVLAAPQYCKFSGEQWYTTPFWRRLNILNANTISFDIFIANSSGKHVGVVGLYVRVVGL